MDAAARRLRFPFGIALIGGIAAEEPDYDAYLRQLIRQVLLVSKGERVCRPFYGADLRQQVFAPLVDTTATLTRAMVFQALTDELGTLLRVEQVTADSNGATLRVTVEYVTRARGERRVLNEE